MENNKTEQDEYLIVNYIEKIKTLCTHFQYGKRIKSYKYSTPTYKKDARTTTIYHAT